MFEEHCKIKLLNVALPIREHPFAEGSDVFQVMSLLNDVNEKQINIKRRRKSLLPSPTKTSEQLHIQEEVVVFPQAEGRYGGGRKSMLTSQGLTPSIGKQQQKVKNPQRDQKAQAMAKILEQGHRPHSKKKDDLKKSIDVKEETKVSIQQSKP